MRTSLQWFLVAAVLLLIGANIIVTVPAFVIALAWIIGLVGLWCAGIYTTILLGKRTSTLMAIRVICVIATLIFVYGMATNAGLEYRWIMAIGIVLMAVPYVAGAVAAVWLGILPMQLSLPKIRPLQTRGAE